MSLGSAFTSFAKFSPSLDQDLVSQPLCPRCSVCGFLSIPAARSSLRYCSSSLATPMKYLLLASSVLSFRVSARCLGSMWGQGVPGTSSYRMQSEASLSLLPEPLVSSSPRAAACVPSLPSPDLLCVVAFLLGSGAGLPSVAGLLVTLHLLLDSMMSMHLRMSSLSIPFARLGFDLAAGAWALVCAPSWRWSPVKGLAGYVP